jgi:hypothetical protein
VGAVCLTNLTVAPTGAHSRSPTSPTALPIELAIVARNSSASPAGSTIRSTVPLSTEEIVRSSSTDQSVPTPRQSQLNVPSQSRSAACSCSGDSCSLRPSVSRMACRIASGCWPSSWPANRNHAPMVVPPAGSSRRSASLASARVHGSEGTSCGSAGQSMWAPTEPATSANHTPSRSSSIAAHAAQPARPGYQGRRTVGALPVLDQCQRQPGPSTRPPRTRRANTVPLREPTNHERSLLAAKFLALPDPGDAVGNREAAEYASTARPHDRPVTERAVEDCVGRWCKKLQELGVTGIGGRDNINQLGRQLLAWGLLRQEDRKQLTAHNGRS